MTVGGIALQAHGGQRLTQDLDIVIESSRPNLERLGGALVDMDARLLGPAGERSQAVPTPTLLAAGDQWHLITPHGPLDVLTLPARLGTFSDFRSRAHDTPLGDVVVPIASREDLLTMKRAAGRPQDLADIRLLESLDDER